MVLLANSGGLVYRPFFCLIVAKPRKRRGSLDSLLSKSASFIFPGQN
jgi:hypothetical protein